MYTYITLQLAFWAWDSTGIERGRGGGVLINLDTPSAMFFKVVVRAVGILFVIAFTCQLLIFTVVLSINRLLYLSSVAIVRNGDAWHDHDERWDWVKVCVIIVILPICFCVVMHYVHACGNKPGCSAGSHVATHFRAIQFCWLSRGHTLPTNPSSCVRSGYARILDCFG